MSVPPPWPGSEPGNDAETQEVLRFIRRMPAFSPFRRLAEALLSGQPAPADTIQGALQSLAKPSSRRWKERFVAVWALGRAPQKPEDRSAAAGWLVHVLEHGPQLDRRGRFGRSYARTLLALWSIAVIVSLPLALQPLVPMLFASLVIGLPFSLLVLPFSAALDRRRLNRVREASANALGRLAAPESTGALAAAVYDRDTRVGSASAAALARTLPALTQAHCGRFGTEAVRRLCRLLQQPDERLVLDILAALGKVGDSSAIQPVERLVKKSRSPRIREQAGDLLPLLYDRRRRASESSRLLRPATAPDTPAEILLRPAQGAGQTAPDLLLRAAPLNDGSAEEGENAELKANLNEYQQQ